MPEFIQDFHDNVTDSAAGKQLRDLSNDFNEKYERLQKSKSLQSSNAHMQKHFGVTPKKVDFSGLERGLKNEYKLKTQAIAKPHMDEKQFEEYAKKHAPEKEPIKEIDKHDSISHSQEKMNAMQASVNAKKQEAIQQPVREKNQGHDINASQEKSQELIKEERARKARELAQQFAKTREMTKERKL